MRQKQRGKTQHRRRTGNPVVALRKSPRPSPVRRCRTETASAHAICNVQNLLRATCRTRKVPRWEQVPFDVRHAAYKRRVWTSRTVVLQNGSLAEPGANEQSNNSRGMQRRKHTAAGDIIPGKLAHFEHLPAEKPCGRHTGYSKPNPVKREQISRRKPPQLRAECYILESNTDPTEQYRPGNARDERGPKAPECQAA